MTALNATPLLDWMRERQAIHRRRAAGEPWPWTEDEVMRRYRFCNVFRELDKTTAWVRERWREPFADHPRLPFAMALARMVNWPDTLEEVGFPKRWDGERFVRIMKARQARGDKMITSAYQIWPDRGGSVATRVAKSLDALWPLGSRWVDQRSLRQTFQNMLPLYGFGPFTSYEVVTDLRHTRWLRGATDIMTWCNIGQGSRRGLNIVAGRRLEAKVPESQAMAEVQELLRLAKDKLGQEDPMFARLEMRDIEHSLCELQKYLRAKGGAELRWRFKQPKTQEVRC